MHSKVAIRMERNQALVIVGCFLQCIFCRFLFFILYAFMPNAMFFVIGPIIAFNVSLLIMAIQPFKSSVAHYNLLNAVFAQLFAIFLMADLGTSLSDMYMKQLKYFFYVLSLIISSAGLFYAVFHIFHAFFKHLFYLYHKFCCRHSIQLN